MKKSFLFAAFFLVLSVLSPLHGADQTTIFLSASGIESSHSGTPAPGSN